MPEYSQNIQNRIKRYHKDTIAIFKAIEKYDHIVIIAHKIPDFDAYGSQFGIGQYIKDNYPHKTIKIVGETNPLYNGDLYPEMDILDDKFLASPFLALMVDTATQERASSDSFKQATMTIKIDHHPNVEPFGDYCFVDASAVAVSEILTILILGHGGVISKETSTYLLSGIVGDSGRFKYASTTATTFAATEILINHGANLTEVYTKLYTSDLSDLRLMGYILSNYHITEHGFIYYIFDDNAQKTLNIAADRAKEQVNLFSGIRGVQAWCAITEKKDAKEWRVSIRSAGKPIHHIAEKWRGGGHPQASGATLLSVDEIKTFVDEMDEYLS